MVGIELPEDVIAVLRSVATLFGDQAPDVPAADPAAEAAENRTITRARAHQARRHATVLGAQVEQLWKRHHELRAATLRAQAPSSESEHQAVGMLVLVFGVTPAQAGQLLVMLSWHHGCSPETVARQMVTACVREHASETIVADTPQDDPGRRDSTPPDLHTEPLTVRRAITYIETHLCDDITVDDISTASGVGQRALQHAFRRHLGASPTQYLRRVRMEHAHRQLLAADPARGDTVAAIADTWRFTHHGRFALDYRATYGTSPAEALRN